MRVQQRGQSLRLRIDEAELARLLAGDTVENATRWPDGRIERQQLALAGLPGWQRTEAGWRMWLPADAVRVLAARLPSRDGLSFEVPVAADGSMQVVFDVDVRDSARRLRTGKEGSA